MSDQRLLDVVFEGELRNGVIVFGLYPAGPAPEPVFPANAWRSMEGFDQSRLLGEAWQVIEWDLAIDNPPTGDRWRDALRRTLRAHLDAGAVIAWVGGEGDFCDPPSLFDCGMAVHAVLSRNGDYECRLIPGRPLDPLDATAMRALRLQTSGLAESG